MVFNQKYLEKVAILDFKTRLESLIGLIEKYKTVDNDRIAFKTDFNPITQQFALDAGHTEYLLKDIKSTGYLEPALLSCGGILSAVDDILNNKCINAFATIPVGGHHAGPSKHWGFCYLNDVACAVHHLRTKYNLKKILYIDQDFHHGDGTEKFFEFDKDFFFIDTHYQRTGEKSFVKIDRKNNNIDISLPKGLGGDDFCSIIKEAIDFAINTLNFNPDFVINYAGYDSHVFDEFNNGRLLVDYHSFVELVNVYRRVAENLCEGRLLCILGGGYSSKNPEVTATCIYNTLMHLSNKYDYILRIDDKIQESDPIAKIKANSILKEFIRYRYSSF